MANRLFPSSARVGQVPLWIEYPGQRPLDSPYDGSYQVVFRSRGRFTGRLVILETGRGEESRRREIESFLASLEGMRHTSDFPIERDSGGTVAGGMALRVTAVNGDFLTVDNAGGTLTGRLVRGDYVRMNDRLHILLSDQSAVEKRIEVHPPASVAVGTEVIWESVTMRARMTKLDSPGYDPDFAGPWSLLLVEDVG